MKKKVIVGFICIVVIVTISVLLKPGKANNTKVIIESAVLLNDSDTTRVKRGDVANVIVFTGDLSPLNQSVISSEVDAMVKEVLVQEGQYVTRGQKLAILDDTDLAGAVSMQEALLASARARFLLDKNKLERQKSLLDQGFISKIAYDELQTNYQASLEAINQQQASLLRAKKQLSDTVIRAPFTGYLYQKSIDTGQLATKNGKLFSIASLDTLQIKAAIPSEKINRVKVGQKVSFSIETNPLFYSGTVTRINPVAEVGTRSYNIYIDFDNRSAKLKAGQFVKGQIVLDTLYNQTYVSYDAVRKLGNDSYILVITNGIVVRKPVKVLLTNRLINISAVSGVNESEVALLSNVLSIKPGDHAKIVN